MKVFLILVYLLHPPGDVWPKLNMELPYADIDSCQRQAYWINRLHGDELQASCVLR